MGSILNKKLSAPVKPVVGRSEKIGLPQFEIDIVDAKIDTGAYGCSLHCTNIEVVEVDGKKMLRIIPLRFRDKAFRGESHLFPFDEKKKVKNSFGKVEERYLIKTKVRIFDQEIETIFSLTDRSTMRFPVLLGRRFLQKRFLVDVGLKDRSLKSTSRKTK